MGKTKYLLLIFFAFALNGCGAYNFTGTGKIDAKTFQVNYFQNVAPLIEPGIDRTFTQRLQNLIQDQTNLSLTNSNGDLVYEGEIIDYHVSPMTATADQQASQSRLSISVKVKFTNKKKEEDDFEKTFSFYDDFSGNSLPSGAQLTKSLDIIFERITQDIFNASLAKW